jgi:lactoylglutathione lyase
MSRFQLALNVDNLAEGVAFYSKLFNTRPTKLKEGYANFAVAQPPLKLVLIENPGHGGTINHLGVEVESSDTVHSEISRLAGEGMITDEEIGTTCCFAKQRQGVGHRSRRREVGGLHSRGRLGNLRYQPRAVGCR